LEDSVEEYGAGPLPVGKEFGEQMGAVFEEPVKAATARIQALGEFVDLNARGAFLDQGPAGCVEPDLSA
jgi:hypothetical protein